MGSGVGSGVAPPGVGNGEIGARLEGAGEVGDGGRVTSVTGARVLSVPASTTATATAARMAMQLVDLILNSIAIFYESSSCLALIS